MSSYEHFARITCACGAQAEVEAWAEDYYDGGVMAHAKPDTGRGGELGSCAYVPWECPACVERSDREAAARRLAVDDICELYGFGEEPC